MNIKHYKLIKRSGCSLLLANLALAVSSFAWADCSYTITNNWGSGFTGEIKVTNNTNQTVNGWTVTWKDSATITSSWNATLTGSNPYTATALSWNGTLAPNASASFGFQGTGNASVATVTGSLCGAAVPSSSKSSTPVSSAAPSSKAASSVVVSSTPASSVAPSSKATSSAATNTSLILQEDQSGFCSVNGTIDSNNSGYTGSGFANTDNTQGAAITWAVNASNSSRYTLVFRFANGGSSARNGSLVINGGSNGNYTVELPTTGGWTNWQTASVEVDLVQGNNNVKLSALSAEGLPNVDSLTLVGAAATPGSCGTTASSTPASSSSAPKSSVPSSVPQSSSSVASSTPSNNNPGYISITDKAPGWASMNGGTTGGGTDLSKAITVTNMSALKSAVSGSSSKIVLVAPGVYDGTLTPGANTTIIGTKPGVIISGNINISGSDKYNIIVRNISVRGKQCGSYDECRSGADGVYIGSGAHHVWFDHFDVADGQDGNFDVTRSGDFVTCSWCKFHYTYNKEHKFSNLIAGSDDETESRGKLNITYMFSMWGDLVGSRQPLGRFGKVHMLNNYHKNTGDMHGVGKEMQLLAEGCTYDNPGKPAFFTMGGAHTGWKGIGNEGTAKNVNDSTGSVFKPPYSYSVMPASQAKAAILSSKCGVGNTCDLKM